MTASQKGDRPAPILQEIETLQAQVEANPTDWVAKMRLAETLEQHGKTDEARALYQQVVAADPGGLFAANKATGMLSHREEKHRAEGKPALAPSDRPSRLRGLPLRRKLLLALLGSKLLAVSVLVVAGVWVFSGAQQRLVLQNASERLAMYLNDAATKKSLEKILAGNTKASLPLPSTGAASGRYAAVYLQNSTGDLSPIASVEKVKESARSGVPLPETDLLLKAAANRGSTVTGWVKLQNRPYAIAARALPGTNQAATPIVAIGTLENQMDKRLGEIVAVLLGVGAVLVAFDLLLVRLLVSAIAEPIERLRQATQKLIGGDRSVRVPAVADGEIGLLAESFNQLAEHLSASAAAMEEEARQRIAEVAFQVREKERLQQGIKRLSEEIADAKNGNLTVRARVDAGELGAIATSCNATIESLQQIVSSLRIAANQVREGARHRSWEMEKLSHEASNQVKAIAAALDAAADIGRSMQSVASTTLQAAVIARQGVAAAKNGCKITKQAAASIEEIRYATAEACEKVNRLAESCQEISKIVSLIAAISDKTAILSFNASIAAARTGEQGQAFRLVATEVRGLAERVKDSAREIEQLVSTIQQGVAEARETMEGSAAQVEEGTQLVVTTQQTLRKLAGISQNINQLLQSISASTVSQAQSSQQVNQTMQAAAAIAQTTSAESTNAVGAFEELVEIAENLQDSVSRFRVDETAARRMP